jgi:hypothetical protein
MVRGRYMSRDWQICPATHARSLVTVNMLVMTWPA